MSQAETQERTLAQQYAGALSDLFDKTGRSARAEAEKLRGYIEERLASIWKYGRGDRSVADYVAEYQVACATATVCEKWATALAADDPAGMLVDLNKWVREMKEGLLTYVGERYVEKRVNEDSQPNMQASAKLIRELRWSEFSIWHQLVSEFRDADGSDDVRPRLKAARQALSEATLKRDRSRSEERKAQHERDVALWETRVEILEEDNAGRVEAAERIFRSEFERVTF